MTTKWQAISKKVGKIILTLVVLLCIGYGALGWYVSAHHDELLKEVRQIANENCKGEVTIGDLEVLFFVGFPT